MYTHITPRQIRNVKEAMARKFAGYGDKIQKLKIPERCDYEDENKQLGKGTFGIISVAKVPYGNELVVLKSFITANNSVDVSIIRELCLLNELTHQNIVKMLRICCEECKIYFPNAILK